jgi:hypothetical protein
LTLNPPGTLRRFTGLFAVLALSGCAAVNAPALRVDMQAKAGQFQPVAAFAELPVRGWLRQPAPAAAHPTAAVSDAALTVYIEGDGAEWQGKYQPPADPTPENALTLRLALRDPDARVAYLGRPCQYLERDALGRCPPILWLNGRYGEHAVTMMSAAVDLLLLAARVQRVRLVGYSGGGVLAALLAARRADVTCLVTVASPLDTDAWTAAIDVSPLSASLNPLAQAPALKHIAQTHIAATDDPVVPVRTLSRFAEALPDARVEVIDAFDHDCCWVYAWERLRQRTCLAAP